MLQQYLPFTVLKRPSGSGKSTLAGLVATVPTVYGIETREIKAEEVSAEDLICCNSTYRLRY